MPPIARSPSRAAGFTLVEILIVVFIIGLLATIVSVNVLGRTDDARVTKAIADLKKLESALALFKLDNGFFPTTEQGLKALIEKPTIGRKVRKYPADGYLDSSSVPPDPWQTPYVYISDGRSYILRSLGADGEQGGDEYDADIDSKDAEAS